MGSPSDAATGTADHVVFLDLQIYTLGLNTAGSHSRIRMYLKQLVGIAKKSGD